MTPVARRLLIAAVVIVVLLIAADRIGNYVAERTAADTIETSQHLSSRPQVDIGGFPFLTQLASGKFDQVTITAKDLPVGQDRQLLDVSRLKVVLHKVTVSRDFSRVQAATADATATVSYAELSRTLGVQVGFAGNGRVKASTSVTVAGRTVSASVSARPQLINGALGFGATRINGVGAVGQAVTDALAKVFALDIPLQGLPFKVRVQALRVEASGVFLELTGRDLTYTKS
jgi:hypothetical protein